MPRVRQRKTTTGQADLSTYKQAYEDVKAGSSLRTAAKKNRLNYYSLLRHVCKREATGSDENQEMGYKTKEEIRREYENRLKQTKAKQVKKLLDGGKSKRNESLSSEEEECYCVVCMSAYSEIRPRKKWIQCTEYKMWAHEECTKW